MYSNKNNNIGKMKIIIFLSVSILIQRTFVRMPFMSCCFHFFFFIKKPQDQCKMFSTKRIDYKGLN